MAFTASLHTTSQRRRDKTENAVHESIKKKAPESSLIKVKKHIVVPPLTLSNVLVTSFRSFFLMIEPVLPGAICAQLAVDK